MTYRGSFKERIRARWRSAIYGFYLPEVTVGENNKRKCLEFVCAAQGCRQIVRRYLDTGDRSSSSNLGKHAKGCWGRETVEQAKTIGDKDAVRQSITSGLQKNGQISDYFTAGATGEKKKNAKQSYSHQQMSRRETRYVTRGVQHIMTHT